MYFSQRTSYVRVIRKAAFICSPDLWSTGHGGSHPLRPVRLKMTYELLQAYAAFSSANSSVVAPRPATDDELALWHTPGYVDAVKRLAAGDKTVNPWAYRLGSGDNPIFPQMYETEALKAGSSLLGAEMLVRGEVDVAFSFSGGLHHAMANHASGFCVFNDAAVALRWLMAQGKRVVYVDIDAHHGDGVQAAFYDTDRVLTISLHESGEFLFPGSGFVDELGKGQGRGYSVNMPLFPYTEDDLYLEAFERIVLPLIDRFKPDILATQLGADSHFQDPLAHLQLTTLGYARMIQAFRDLNLPWLALGGGGYNVGTVARIWANAYGTMSDQPLPDEIPASWAGQYGLSHLHDRDTPQIDRHKRALAREYAETQMTELERMLGKL
ncbi:MAG: acetoin utilization protein AcuC [Anaerolineae bacterium]|nr:acetoin utilization protein AcuC [Anaerolineae bacterium]